MGGGQGGGSGGGGMGGGVGGGGEGGGSGGGTAVGGGDGGGSGGGAVGGGTGGGGTGGGGTGGGGTGGGSISSTVTVGPAGGMVMAGGASVTVPANALTFATDITLETAVPPVPVPSIYTARSAIFAFKPHGEMFTTPVTITLPFTTGGDAVLRLDDENDSRWQHVPATFGASSVTFMASRFSFYVVIQTPTVHPLYLGAAYWNEYVENDGPTQFAATGADCETNTFSQFRRWGQCIHGGQHRKVKVTGRTSCGNLTATDALGAFEWTCEVMGGVANMVSTDFKSAAGLSTLIDFNAAVWKQNSVTVNDGAAVVLTTPSAVWWPNPMVVDNDGTTQTAASTIYLVTADSNAEYYVSGAGSALVVKPGVTLTPPLTEVASARVVVGGFGSWVEVRMTGADQNYPGIYMSQSAGQSVVHRSDIVGYATGVVLSGDRFRLERLRVACAGPNADTAVKSTEGGHFLKDLRSARCPGGILTGPNSKLNVMENLHLADGPFAQLGNNSVMAGVTVHHSPENGVVLGIGEGRMLMHVTTVQNVFDGFNNQAQSSVFEKNQVIGLLATENRSAGVALNNNLVLRDVGSFLNTHYGYRFNAIDYGLGVTFEGLFTVGYNGPTPPGYFDGQPCLNLSAHPAAADCAFSRDFPDDAGVPNGLLSFPDGGCGFDTNFNAGGFNPTVPGVQYPLVKGAGSDTTNPNEDVDGNANHDAITDWLSFDNPYRGWGLWGSSGPHCTTQGPCVSGDKCRMYDYSLRASGVGFIWPMAMPTSNGNSVLHHDFFADNAYDGLTTADCSRFIASPVITPRAQGNKCTATFLVGAREILGDLRGNDNLLCESNEVCLFTPNMASYQGHGPLVSPAGYTFTNGTIQNVKMLKFQTNGVSAPYTP